MATKEPIRIGIPEVSDMAPHVNPEFFVSTYTASQFYQPPPPKWLKMKTVVPKNLEKPAKESLKALESLADMRTKLAGYDTNQIDLLIDHKININAQFTPRNAFDYPEEYQLERLSRLAEVRKKLAQTDYGLANLDIVLKAGFDNLILATGISRSHSVSQHRLGSCADVDMLTVPHRTSSNHLLQNCRIRSHHPGLQVICRAFLQRSSPTNHHLPGRRSIQVGRQRSPLCPSRCLESQLGGEECQNLLALFQCG